LSSPFRKRITSSLKNPVLQAALDANAVRRIGVRMQAFASMDDYELRRQKAHALRSEVISNLDLYLEKFIENVQANGITVHRTTTAEEAVAVVLDIAAKNQVRLAAKSKTMVSEEIHLNQAMENAGIQVVETDLGEYIVQLRNEPPSHIITPAVHLRRQEVGQTFHEKLGIPLTDDIGKMTEAARSVLRQVFLQADLGISGVNFGVAETGTLCLVTNEGNGRMVTTLPRVHVALMGIERLVPSMKDLALMISLLPRSATGQKITVYTSLIHSPRREGESDGPAQRHLVLVDNGRRSLKDGPLAEILYCIRCGACLNACPIFRELGGHSYVGAQGQGSPYPGPMGSVVSPGLYGLKEFGHLARASTLCGACKDACPVDIDLPRLLLRLRAGIGGNSGKGEVKREAASAPGGLKYGLKIYTWIATSSRRFKLAVQSAALLSRLISPFNRWMKLPAFTGWGYGKDFPRPAWRPFRSHWRELAQISEAASPRDRNSDRASQSAAERTDVLRDVGAVKEDLFQRFARELRLLGGEVIFCKPENLSSQVSGLLAARGLHTIFSWEDSLLPTGLLEQLRREGISITHENNPDVPAGLTGALAGAADTGSIVIPSGAGRPLNASLITEIHLAVVRARDIYPSLEVLFSEHGVGSVGGNSHFEQLTSASSAAIISGPSRTADIEMTLTIGVHGPREVVVFCVED
jgi:L-lactate dehydrogenase complex protein LldF